MTPGEWPTPTNRPLDLPSRSASSSTRAYPLRTSTILFLADGVIAATGDALVRFL